MSQVVAAVPVPLPSPTSAPLSPPHSTVSYSSNTHSQLPSIDAATPTVSLKRPALLLDHHQPSTHLMTETDNGTSTPPIGGPEGGFGSGSTQSARSIKRPRVSPPRGNAPPAEPHPLSPAAHKHTPQPVANVMETARSVGKSLEGPYQAALNRLFTQLKEKPETTGLAQLVRFCALTPLSTTDHKKLHSEVLVELKHDHELRRDFIEFEHVLDPAAVMYNRKPSAQFPELLDPAFPSTDYDQIMFMRHFVAFAVTRLQYIRELCAKGSVEKDLVSHCVRAWCTRAMDYI